MPIQMQRKTEKQSHCFKAMFIIVSLIASPQMPEYLYIEGGRMFDEEGRWFMVVGSENSAKTF